MYNYNKCQCNCYDNIGHNGINLNKYKSKNYLTM